MRLYTLDNYGLNSGILFYVKNRRHISSPRNWNYDNPPILSYLITLHGFPPAILSLGISLTTTLPAAIIDLAPI